MRKRSSGLEHLTAELLTTMEFHTTVKPVLTNHQFPDISLTTDRFTSFAAARERAFLAVSFGAGNGSGSPRFSPEE